MTIETDNGFITLITPTGFVKLTNEEIDKLGGRAEENSQSVYDMNLHLIFEVAWKKIHPWARKLPLERVVKKAQEKISDSLSTFAWESDLERTIDGLNAKGFRYTFSKKDPKNRDINMTSEYLLVKRDNEYVAFIALGRTESFLENHKLFDEILDNIKISYREV